MMHIYMIFDPDACICDAGFFPDQRTNGLTDEQGNSRSWIHSGEKSNECTKCEYKSSDVSILREYLTAHTGEKPNKCNHCYCASAWASDLRIHLKTHTGERPYKCNHCDYASVQAGHLRRHLKTHSEENPFSDH